jgi:hypothetical protein
MPELTWKINEVQPGLIDIIDVSTQAIVLSLDVNTLNSAIHKAYPNYVIGAIPFTTKFKMKTHTPKASIETKLALSVTEILSVANWLKKHTKVCTEVAAGAELNFLKISFDVSSESGIGQNVYATCECGAIEDITDYGSW